jgi:ubiquitin-conjugating enzyme E2 C
MNTDRNVSAFPEGESLFKWIGTISGPKGTVSNSEKCHVIIKGYGLGII